MTSNERRTPTLHTFVIHMLHDVLDATAQWFNVIITPMHTRDDIKRLTELASCAG
jgi:hypothetical protein